MFQYYLKVVGTRYYYLDMRPVFTNQFSVTQYNRNLQYKNAWGQIQAPNGLPGVFFNFDISPMLVIQKEEHESFTSFLTGICAIVGGIFTVASLLDGAIWRAERTFKTKMELGKAF
ncbi:Endoplasmic reticulum-Golgi intermediate compartment protein 3 [Mortierella sp. NVP41]|nr:Endoplasmic reticulum-Golgi intermediate compartment protein 3 [Mortierella sp. NVP41]